MILEVATLDIRAGQNEAFETNFNIAQKIISSMKGYRSHELQKCIEKLNRYLLLVKWDTIEDHEIGFRKSEEYLKWKELLHKFHDPFPTVEHYEIVLN